MFVNKPPLGWNSWNTYGKDVSEKLLMETADAMVETGLKDAGYNYVVLDDCWSLRERDENGRLVADPEKFPHGMKYVADYIHSKGLKFGMYSCAGALTCAGFPGSYDHEFIDAATFAEWGVDFLKYDYCYHSENMVPGHVLYKRMGLALENCGRDILFSACSWGVDGTEKWIKQTSASMWRSTWDIFDKWDSITELFRKQYDLHNYNGHGCFNDMDMLVVGMNGKGNVGLGGCTFDEYKFHFTAWSLFGSPLMIGCDVRNMTDETKEILLNKDVLAINQDEGCRQPYRVNGIWNDDNRVLFVRNLVGGDIAIGFFNMSDDEGSFRLTIDEVGLPMTTGKTLEATELWTGETFTVKNGVMTGSAPKHAARLYRCKVVDI